MCGDLHRPHVGTEKGEESVEPAGQIAAARSGLDRGASMV